MVHQQREPSRSVLRAQSQMNPCGGLLGRMSGRSGSRGCSASCGLWSEDLLLFGSSSPPLIIPGALQSGPSPPRHRPSVPARLWYRATNEREAELSHKSVCARVCACVNSNILYQSHIRQIYLTLGHVDKKKLQILFFSDVKLEIPNTVNMKAESSKKRSEQI